MTTFPKAARLVSTPSNWMSRIPRRKRPETKPSSPTAADLRLEFGIPDSVPFSDNPDLEISAHSSKNYSTDAGHTPHPLKRSHRLGQLRVFSMGTKMLTGK